VRRARHPGHVPDGARWRRALNAFASRIPHFMFRASEGANFTRHGPNEKGQFLPLEDDSWMLTRRADE
jgi:hypothetical protein